MASVSTFLVLALLAGFGSAQRDSGEHVWASVGWILHGERTPYYAPNVPSLTSLGARQMFDQGSFLRARYLDSTGDEEADLDPAPIMGIGRNAIDNNQLDIISTNDPFIFAGALAFMQGLYPPIQQAFSNGSGGMDSAVLSNGTLVNYPLEGYQYPNIQAHGVQDPNSIWTEGHVGCTKYVESLITFRNDEDVAYNYAESREFYKSMWEQVFRDVIPEPMANYYNAYALYDYAHYQYNHNNDNATEITADELATLSRLAASEQRSRNGNLSASGAVQGDMIRAVAGRTMAAKVLDWFGENIRTEGESNKLSLAFTAIEPFMAWFSLSQLTKGPSRGTFATLPNPGATMVFELFSMGGNSSQYPEMDELWVRFFYRNGTDPDAALIGYPLFGNGNSQTAILYTEFIREIQDIDISGPAEWCRACESITLYCLGLSSNSDSGGFSGGDPPRGNAGTGPNGVTPTIAGVIGAAVTIGVIGLAVLAAICFGCVSFQPPSRGGAADSSTGGAQRNTSLGGFRGAEKMASDADLAYAKTGSRHERTGSWELRDGAASSTAPPAAAEPVSPLSTAAGASLEPPRGVVRSSIVNRPDDDDAISEIGLAPAKPREF
ncbi:histidine phosphatase superfamily [Rhypophila decipiens]